MTPAVASERPRDGTAGAAVFGAVSLLLILLPSSARESASVRPASVTAAAPLFETLALTREQRAGWHVLWEEYCRDRLEGAAQARRAFETRVQALLDETQRARYRASGVPAREVACP